MARAVRRPLVTRRTALRTLAACVVFASISWSAVAQAPRTLPSRLSDVEFWRLMTDGSEPGGYFQSDNWTSNEMTFPRIVNMLRAANDTGGAYLGVGPEQNFSYITGIRPRIAFLVDIRRQSVLQHLMYKSVFELSADRADFVSLLFSKPRPKDLDTTSTISAIWEAYWDVPTDTTAFERNFTRIRDHLTRTHGFGLDDNDIATLRRVYQTFYNLGPKINYSASTGSTTGFAVSYMVVNGTVTSTTRTVSGASIAPAPSQSLQQYYQGVNFAALTASTDNDEIPRSFLATEDNYRYMKDLHTRNMFIPFVGDFAGPKAIRAVGTYLREHGATLTAFYTSNVEQYLFQNNVWRAFYENAATLPVTPASVFIRSGSSVCPIGEFLAAVAAGRVTVYGNATQCVR